MTRYIPIALGVLLIVGLTIVQMRMTDRSVISPFGASSNVTAEQRAELLKSVPEKIGDWQGENLPIDEDVKKVAGAVGAVSRQYRNVRTGDVVDLWLIVGHGHPVSRHTPDICYRSSGFAARARENSSYAMVMDDGLEVPFLTNTFFRDDATGHRLIRVFWTWYNTENKANQGKVVWEAPSNARWFFGNTRALYKMYFTSQMRDNMETSEKSPCVQFAREFIPVVEEALTEVHGQDSKAGEAANNAKAADSEPKSAVATHEAPADAEPAELEETAEVATPATEEASGTE